MINVIKNYLKLPSGGKSTDYWCEGNAVEMIKMNSEVASYEIICFSGKRKLLFHKQYFYKRLGSNRKEILSSHMVIIRTSLFKKYIIMNMLGQMCKENNCFGPIIFSDDSDILFFPKLKYQDGYLLKSIVEKHLGNKNICIAFGSNDFVII